MSDKWKLPDDEEYWRFNDTTWKSSAMVSDLTINAKSLVNNLSQERKIFNMPHWPIPDPSLPNPYKDKTLIWRCKDCGEEVNKDSKYPNSKCGNPSCMTIGTYATCKQTGPIQITITEEKNGK